ncbi:tRNA delta(2)-isopentenylpyrophosphate transferase [Hyphomicrobium sulfonivorans]|uniref:tRNA dimethylallyltransferase n=1 Tax=Hyphomicrobium sulfonivorans TaxID=121290 RepID=A0A125NUJ2_HYPSL|nr:tRNA (adenosine(37)-N6)-dimethylallyltransferase MiaA [Hyphomicrobium sulfonivorans]KWT66790.1 tRNA delta(2)-isopentenylpyrophosphate transferase [Hyphomicrobium sulfonivorans]
MDETRVILIAGPTASGKSGLALRLAEELGGMVINADAMQVYSELRVLTARPDAEAEARVPHALYGTVAAADAYSAGRYVSDVTDALEQARQCGLRPIIVGGTGLYFKALTDGLSPIPPIDDDVRAHWRAEAAEHGARHLHGVLSGRDPEMAMRLAPGDTQRIVRALEVLESTGRSLAEWQRLPGEPLLPETETVRLLVAPEREELVRRIDRRFDGMVGEGALEEVQQLDALGLDPALPLMGALGVRPFRRHLAGEIGLETAIEASKIETRQYAKRQVTWSRRNMSSWNRLSAQQMECSVGQIMHFVQNAD